MLTAPDQPNVSNPPPSIISSAQNSGAAQKQPTATWAGLTTAVGVGAVLGGAFHLVAPDFPGKTLASFGIALAPAGLYLVSHDPDEEKAVSPFPHITEQFEPFTIKNDISTVAWFAADIPHQQRGVRISTVSAWAAGGGELPPAMDVTTDAFISTQEILKDESVIDGLIGIDFMLDQGWTTLALPHCGKPEGYQERQNPVFLSAATNVGDLPLEHLAVSDVLFCYREAVEKSATPVGHGSQIIGIRKQSKDTYVLFDPSQGAYTCNAKQCRALCDAKNQADNRHLFAVIGFTKQD